VRLIPAPRGRVDMMTTWIVARLAAAISWRAARRPVSRLWFTPWRPAPSHNAQARHRSWLAETTPISLTVDGKVLAGFKAGEGPTVLLIHGWSDRAASLGAFVAPLVERGFTVVGLDLPGHGDSPGGRTNALEMAAMVRGIDRELGGVDAIVAHSIGAFVTVLELGSGLAPRAVSLIAPLVRVDHAIDRFASQLRLSRRAVRALRVEIEDLFGNDAWERFSADLAAPGIEIPALIVHDVDDPETSWSRASILAGAWPGARLMTTRGLGHYRVVRDPDVVDQIADFTAGMIFSSTPASRTESEGVY
jgi:pimeloyl-ACP methyl ester carboxylesterase